MKIIDYTEVREILFQGFLTESIEVSLPTVDSFTVVLKTLNTEEHKLIGALTASNSKGRQQSSASILTLCYATLFFNGCSCLKNREKWISRLFSFYSNLLIKDYAVFMQSLIELSKKTPTFQDTFFRFCYTDESRHEWRLKKRKVNSHQFTGILGTSNLGYNEYQKYWVLFNLTEDQKEQYKLNFNNALFIASAFTDVKKVRSQLEQEDNIEKEKRQRILDGEPFENVDIPQTSHGIKTVAELKAEMERSVRGEKDYHDLVVEDYENRIRMNLEEKIKREVELERQIKDEGLGFLAMNSGTDRVILPENNSRYVSTNPKEADRILRRFGSSYNQIKQEALAKTNEFIKSNDEVKQETASKPNNLLRDKVLMDLEKRDPIAAKKFKDSEESSKKRPFRTPEMLRKQNG